MGNTKAQRRQRQRAERLRAIKHDDSSDSEIDEILNKKQNLDSDDDSSSCSSSDYDEDSELEQEYDKEQLRILRNAFTAFDHNKENAVDVSEVPTLLDMFGQKVDDKQTKALIKEANPSGSDKLEFSQFCKLFARYIEVEEDADAVARELKEAFRLYDREAKGYITVAVLRDILHELDDKITGPDLDLIIDEIDADGSGTVDFDEFMQVMTGD